MSQRSDSNRPPRSTEQTWSDEAISAAEASVRQLIARGNYKIALKRAKEIHSGQGTAVSEALLVEAYGARIQSLIHQNLAVEAQGLLDLVRRRYASATTRLDDLSARVMVRSGSLNEAVKPLNDPTLSTERRTAIERAIQQEVCDLAALAGCEALSWDDPLHKAASALHRAFIAVTSGAVAEDALALPEVSHRSPLAPWKLLVRAMACFYRGDDESCRRQVDAIQPESAPARLVPAIQAALGGKTAAPLTAAGSALVSQMTGDPAALRRALEALDLSFASDRKDRTLKAIRAAVQECRQSSPGHLERLLQHISVRCAIAHLDKDQVMAAMGGPSRHDAYFLRLFARGLEETGDVESLALACSLWAQFRQLAVQEGWFAANGTEAATLYLHVADVLRRIPSEMLRGLQQSARSQNKPVDEELYFLFPEKLYQRACALDPHAEAFSQWMEWAARESAWKAQPVAEAWHKIRPRDLEPVLHLMNAATKQKAFPTALAYLAKAEQIDGVHPGVRGARLPLLAGNAMRHIQQKTLALAEADLAEIAALPQAQQGDRPAFLAVLRYMVSAVRGRGDEAAASRAEVERLLESRAAAAILLHGVATASKRSPLDKLGPVERLAGAERAALPSAVARVTALAADMQLKLDIPGQWIVDTAKQFPRSSAALDSDQLFNLAEAALCAKHEELAYAVSAVGLARAGGTEVRFLLLRARSLPERQGERRAVCAAAAAELARQQRDTEVIKEAVELLRTPSESGSLSLTLDQAGEVLQKEKAEPAVFRASRRGPDYRGLVEGPCPCPKCRRARGEAVEPFDAWDDDDDLLDPFDLPPDMPPEIARMLFEETRSAVLRGESLDELLSRLTGGGRPRRKRKKGRRR